MKGRGKKDGTLGRRKIRKGMNRGKKKYTEKVKERGTEDSKETENVSTLQWN
jgi:hypothetical protein